MVRRSTALLLAGWALIMPLAACGSGPAPAPEASPLSVVASTNVYGDIAERIAGGRATVTSIISDPTADPHSYEANPRNQLALSTADVVIENGGGYDDFVDAMLASAGNGDVRLLNVVELSGRSAASGEELNEHVWYDFPTVAKLADALVTALSAVDPANASLFATNGTALKQRLGQFEDRAAAIKSAHDGVSVAITEPVPLYLLDACGLENRTPDEFSEAIEEGSDVPPAVLRETLDLFAAKAVTLLAYNEQTAGPQTQQVLDAAREHGIPVVSFTETLPAGKGYLDWMDANLSALQSALT